QTPKQDENPVNEGLAFLSPAGFETDRQYRPAPQGAGLTHGAALCLAGVVVLVGVQTLEGRAFRLRRVGRGLSVADGRGSALAGYFLGNTRSLAADGLTEELIRGNGRHGDQRHDDD